MKEIEKTNENIARNLIRFFTLIVFEAGIFSGIGTTLILGSNQTFIRAFVIVLSAITAFMCGWIIWNQKRSLGKEHVENAARGIAQIFIMIVFVAGVILGIAAEMLVGINAAELVVVLFGALVAVGVWLFKDLLLGTWWK